MLVPCKDCPDRYLGCHSKCDKYKAFRAEREAIYEQRKNQAEPVYYDHLRQTNGGFRKWK